MTVEQLNKANEIQKEIDGLYDVFNMLDSTITFEESKNSPVKRFVRFLNCSRKHGEKEQAHIILFKENQIHGRDIPVDLDFLKHLRSYFKDRLDDKIKERNEI
jgi:hypothetical protein